MRKLVLWVVNLNGKIKVHQMKLYIAKFNY
jgi:hypothetical protein